MLTRIPFNAGRLLSRGRPFRIRGNCWVSTAAPIVPLSFDLHLPPSKEQYSTSQRTPAIVLLHGFLGSKTNLRTLSRHLAQSIPTQVYTLDLRNHGESTKNGTFNHTYELMAKDVETFLKEQGLDNVVLAGHSMCRTLVAGAYCRGAKVVLYLALTKPEIPTAVVSLENAPISSRLSPTFQQYMEAMRAVEDAKLTKREDAENMLAKCEEANPLVRCHMLTSKDKGVRQFLMTNLLPTIPLTFRVPLDILSDSLPELGAFPIDGDAEDAPHFDGPALFIKGSQSGYIQEKHFPVMKRLFPKMEVVELEGSHWIHVDQPVEVLKTMSKFVQDHIRK